MKITNIIISAILFLNIKLSADTNEIIWLQNQRPPWMINSGEYKDQGYGDKIRKLFVSKLTNYTHKTIPINFSRFLIELKKRDNVCYGPVAKMEPIASNFHWSEAVYYLPKPYIIVLNSTYEKMATPKELSMEELIQNQNYQFGKIVNLAHYPIDVEKYSSQKNITSVSTTAPITSLLTMLEKQRVDWIYDLPLFIKWHTSLKNTSDNFKTIKVTETKKLPLMAAYMACKKNEWGEKVIREINKNINKKNILKIRSFVRKWQLDGTNLKEYDELNYKMYGY